MTTNKLWRFLFNLLLTAMSAVFGWYAVGDFLRLVGNDPDVYKIYSGPVALIYGVVFVVVGGVFGFALGGAIFRRIEILGDRLQGMNLRDKLALIGGLVIGLILSAVIAIPVVTVIPSKIIGVVVALLIGTVLTYLSTVASLSMKEEIHFYIPAPVEEEKIPKEKFKILDTNVIIDGRVADVARAGFLEGPLYVPGFVLDELQHIADSADSLKRARGRRGLDTLREMDKELNMVFRTYDRHAPPSGEVDNRLVQLAKTLDASLVTNDWNLNKVAELQGVLVLNINDLANALKPVVIPGEDMIVQIVKEGKEAAQGLAYLDDGTMIVVEGGRTHLGETVEVVVSSVLQTSAGKMIFAHLRDGDSNNGPAGGGGGNGDDYGRGVRAYTGGGPRRPVRRNGQ